MEKMSYIDKLITKSSNYDETTDAIVPDLYPDIAKIIMITGKPFIKDISMQNDRALISGEVKCEVLYKPEGEENLIKMMISLSFAHIEEVKDKDCMIFSNINIADISARIINPRKISILANLCLKTDQYKKNTINSFTNKSFDSEVLIKKQKISILDSLNICECVLSDNIEFKGNLSNDTEIFGIKPNIIINDMKLLKNKLMLRGNIEFNGHFIYGNNISPINASSPFSQILDISILDEKLDGELSFCMQNFDLEQNSTEEFIYTLGLRICLIQKKEKEVEIIEDIYDTNYEIELKKTDYTLLHMQKVQSENFEFLVNIPTENIVDNISITEIFPHIYKNEKNSYDFCVNIHAICHENDEIFDISSNYKFAENMPYAEFENCIIKATKNTDFIEFSINIQANKFIENKINLPIIDEIIKLDEKNKKNDEIILKFINNPQSVWDIAKNYSVKKEDILEANQMECDLEIIENMMILIPKK